MERGQAANRATTTTRKLAQPLRASLTFDGASSHVDTPTTAGSTHFNIAFWYKRGRYHNQMETVASNDRDGNGFSLRHDANAKHLYFTVATNNRYTYAMTFGAFPVGQWRHIAITARYNDVRGYIDGKLVFTQKSASMPATKTPISLMNRPGDGRFAKGSLSSVVVENGTYWTSQQVYDIMNGNYPPGAAAVYPLDEGAGTVAYDRSGKNNHATIFDAAFTRDVPVSPRKIVDSNLVPNGDLSFTPPPEMITPVRNSGLWIDNAGGSDGNMFGWNFVVHSGTGMARFDHDTPYNGKPTLKLTALTIGSSVSSGIAFSTLPDGIRKYGIPVLPNTSYTVRVAIKTQVLGGAADRGAYVALGEFSGNGISSGGAVETPFVTTNTDFTVYTKVFTTRSDTRYIVPQLYNRGTDGDGSLRMNAWFGGIELLPTAAAPPYGGRFPAGQEIAGQNDLMKGVGVCNPFSSFSTPEAIRERCKTIKEAGLTWVRTDFRASIINPARDKFIWDGHDVLVQEVLNAGLNLLPILDYSTSWGNGGFLNTSYPWLDPQDFGRYCAAVVARYAPMGIKQYEIWNEPNISTFWQPTPSAAAYATHLKNAYEAIKAVDPSVTVIMGGITGDRDPNAVGPTYHGPFIYLNGIYKYAGSPWDALGYHAYATHSWQEANTLGLRDIMLSHGDEQKRMWITEFGQPTNGGYGQEFVSEATQARFYSGFIRDTRKYPWIGPVFLYNFQDVREQQPGREGYFGLLRADGTYKPSFYAVRNAIRGIYL